jgi:hypothetical protein
MRARAALAGGLATFAFAATGAALPAAADELVAEKPPTLKPIDSCRALARYARRHSKAVIVRDDARKRHGAPELRSGDPVSAPDGEAGAGGSQSGGEGGDDFSRTNVQEQGVDEPDAVKTDGAHLFVADAGQGNMLHAVDARAATPTVAGSLKLPGYDAELLLSGDRILAITWDDGGSDEDVIEYTILSEIDVSNPAAMRVLRTEKVEGYDVSARLHGDLARVAIVTPPEEIVVEQPAGVHWNARQRRAQRRRAVRRAPLGTWRASEVVADRTTGVRTERGAVPCDAVRRPREYSGLGMLSVLTVDLRRGLPAVDADAVFADGDTLYAGNGGLYVATEEWIDRDTELEDLPTQSVTSIHKFAIEGAETSYRASGSVPGYMLSQWSMSEHEGHLRTATTNEPPWIDDREPETESQVIVLAERDGALAEVGRAGGLGRGERIRAVRFMGDRGFVVTFREIDPLFALDLSVPEAPRVAGELKIPGYSAYLHPVGEDLLLGVGQDATDRGELRGLQLSLFDVSDMTRPQRTAAHTIAGGSESFVEWDHRAFLFWPPTGLAVIPVDIWEDDVSEKPAFAGAIGFRVDASSIAEAWRIASPPMDDPYDWSSPPHRNVVIGDRLFSVWQEGVRASRLDDVSQGTWVDLPRARSSEE